MATPIVNIRNHVKESLRISGMFDIYGGIEVYVGAAPAGIITPGGHDPYVVLIPAGGGTLGQNARSDMGIGKIRMDSYCYVEPQTSIEILDTLRSEVSSAFRSIRPDIEGLLSCVVEGGPNMAVSEITRQKLIWDSYIVGYVAD